MVVAKEKPNTRNGKPLASKAPLVIAVTRFGSFSNGSHYVAVPLTISRADLALDVAGETLCGRRITGTLLARPAGSSATQESIPGLDDGADVTLAGVFSVGAFTVGPKAISVKLSFAIPTTARERGKLFEYAGRAGLLTVDAVEDLHPAEPKQAAAGE